jgi:hypothetical protein
MTRPDISTAPVSHLAVAPPTVAQRQTAQPVPFFSCIQAIVRHAAAPISDQSANRAGQKLARGAQAVGDGDWI